MILGLMTTEQFDATKSENHRRRVFYQYPNGAFPLAGLLSVMDEQSSDKTKFGWWEKRWENPRSDTAQANSAGPFTNTSGTDLTAAGWSQAVQTSIRVYVDDASVFRVRDVIWIRNVPGTSNSLKQIRAQVTAVDTTDDYLTVRLVQAVANALNSTAANDIEVTVVGTASEQGGYAKRGGTAIPTNVENYMQIFRTVVGPFSRSALAEGARYDSTGIYKSTAKEDQLRHMTTMELAMLTGRRFLDSTTTNDDGDVTPTFYMGGIEWFMEQWELGNTGNNGAYEYRPNGADITASDWETEELKRIIDLADTSISQTQMNELLRRLFDTTNNSSYEKLCVCDSRFLATFQNFFERASIRTTTLNSKEDSYGMHVTMWESIHGRVYFKTHPLYKSIPSMQNSGLFLDVANLKYTAKDGGDTQLLKNRQSPGFDGRKDEWLTECGLEVRYPESNLLIRGLSEITL